MERPHLPWLHIPILSKIYTNAFNDLHERILQIYYIFKTCAVLITNYYGITKVTHTVQKFDFIKKRGMLFYHRFQWQPSHTKINIVVLLIFYDMLNRIFLFWQLTTWLAIRTYIRNKNSVMFAISVTHFNYNYVMTMTDLLKHSQWYVLIRTN